MTLIYVVIALGVAVVTLAALWRGEVRARAVGDRLHADMLALVKQHVETLERQNAVERGEHMGAMEALHERHAIEITRLVTLTAFGQSSPGEATRLPAKEGPEQRMERAVSEASIRRGADELKRRYEAKGLALSDEEAVTQATSMLSLQTPTEYTPRGGA